MATERDFELLDDYLTNRLNAQDRSSFEQKLEADPDLKTEYRLQQRLVDGIQKARIAELKGMLNNIPVAPAGTSGTSVIGKFAIGTFVAGAVITGVYFYFNEKKETQTPGEVHNTVQAPKDETPVQEQPADRVAQDETVVKNEGKSEQRVEPKSEPNAKAKEDTEVVAEKRPLEVFDPSTEAEGDKPLENAGEAASKEAKPSVNSMPVEVDRTNKKYTFHYQFKGDRLVLYGPFEKNLYEIMEFFSEDDKRTAFLYYKEGYYQLKEDATDKIRPLLPISDQTLIKKLKEYRSN
jgi:hypothetical protein